MYIADHFAPPRDWSYAAPGQQLYTTAGQVSAGTDLPSATLGAPSGGIVDGEQAGSGAQRARLDTGPAHACDAHAATRRKERLVSNESLKRRIAGWENQHRSVSEMYRDLLCDAYDLSAAELGLVAEPAVKDVEPAANDPTERIRFSRLDNELVVLLGANTQSLRMLDRRLGGAATYPQTAAHVEQIEAVVRQALPRADREAAAGELSQAAALAGWQALDMGQPSTAWRMHEIATAAGRESGDLAGLTYAQAQQAYVLLDADRAADAHNLIKAGQKMAGSRVPPALRAWLKAAEGEALAAVGDGAAALRALDTAAKVLPDHADGELPYVMLDAGHLARCCGHCLARLGDGGAIDNLQRALSAMGEGQYGLAEVGLRVDLALAYQARGDVNAARMQAQLAADNADLTGSARQRRRIAALLQPQLVASR